MYALLDETDNLVGGEPIDIYRKLKAITLPDGTQLPKNWLELTSPAEQEAVHIWPMTTNTWDKAQFHATGEDETYTFDGVTIAETTPTAPNAEPESLNAYKDAAFGKINDEVQDRIEAAETTPEVGVDYTGQADRKARADSRRNNKAKSKDKLKGSDEHLVAHIDLIHDGADLITIDVDSAVDYAAVDAVLAGLETNPAWPVWSPITL